MNSQLSRNPIFSSISYSNKLPSLPGRFHASSLPCWCFSRRISSRHISCSSEEIPSVRQTITISYSELKDKNADLSAKIEDGFGPNGLGILSISQVPGFASLRQNLLHLSPRLASLPEEVKKELEDPHSRYNFGWSHGKEKLESGKPDMLKGSFYANPVFDTPTSEASLIQRYASYCRPNIWPGNALPELEVERKCNCQSRHPGGYISYRFVELPWDGINMKILLRHRDVRTSPTFKSLGKLMLDVGLMLAYHCDQYVSRGMTVCDSKSSLEQILLSSRCHKGRLLYYFPAEQRNCTQDGGSKSSWCGWHTDHGSLTGLTCGLFTRDAVEIPCPDSAAGLYIKTRTDQIVKDAHIFLDIVSNLALLSKVVFGEDEIAYQIGETTEILSRGSLCATPHCVRAPKGEKAFGVERSTFALFMQPDWDESLKFPRDVHLHQELVLPNGSLTFGEYSEKLLDKYYHLKA